MGEMPVATVTFLFTDIEGSTWLWLQRLSQLVSDRTHLGAGLLGFEGVEVSLGVAVVFPLLV